MNFVQQLRGDLCRLLPQDKGFHNILNCVMESWTHNDTFTSEELAESRDYLETLLANKTTSETECDAKHLHLLTFACAAWLDKEELVATLLQKTPYDKSVIKDCVAMLFVYRKKWTSLQKIEEFCDHSISQYVLMNLAFCAGAGDNLNLVRDLRDRDPHLLNSAYKGAMQYNKKQTVESLKLMGLSFAEYQSLTVPVETDGWKMAQTGPLLLIAVLLLRLVTLR